MNVHGRSDARERELLDRSEDVRAQPELGGFLRLIALMVLRAVRGPVGIILASAIVLIMAWGQDGALPWLRFLWPDWRPGADPAGRPSVIPGLPWDQEWLSFSAGVVLLVLIPCALIRWVLRQDLRDYGLGLPDRSRLRLSIFSAVFLLAVSLPFFYWSTSDEGMQDTYPLYRGELDGWDFVVYETGYLLFFVAIEFIFRGYLLLGLFSRGAGGPLRFGYQAIFVSMLSYTAWHLAKPTPELWGTLFWGPVAGAVVLLTRSIWPVVIVHWLLNVILDLWLI